VTRTTVCQTCGGYEFVPNPKTNMLVDCPDCRGSRPVRTAKDFCPEHGNLLVAGKCWACRKNASEAQRRIVDGALDETLTDIARNSANGAGA
jgi:hypothetical protein